MKDGQLFRIKIIKTDADLPKERVSCYWHWKNRELQDVVLREYYNDDDKDYWLAFDWYLQPIEESKVNCNICGKNKIDIYPICAKCWDDAHPKQQVEEQKSKLKEIMPMESEINEQAELHFDKHTIACRTWIGGAKWLKSEIEERNK